MERFKVPLQSEVAAYMREKKRWPQAFCKYYAEKFWNYYNSNGWKVGNKAAMKSWQSAFVAQWQTVRHPEDIAELNKHIGQQKATPPNGNSSDPYQRLNARMIEDQKGIDLSEKVYCGIYDWLEKNIGIEIKPFQEDIIKDMVKDYSPEVRECRQKVMKVKFLFSNMYANGKTFKPVHART